MRQVTIRIPDGWFAKLVARIGAWVVGVSFVAMLVPFWWVKVRSWVALEEARSRVETQRVLGECSCGERVSKLTEENAVLAGPTGEVAGKR